MTFFRELYDVLNYKDYMLELKNANDWFSEKVFMEIEGFNDTIDFFHDIRDRIILGNYNIQNWELCVMYAFSRVIDSIITKYLPYNNWPIDEPCITIENFEKFLKLFGMNIHTVEIFHPFTCEIVNARNYSKNKIEIENRLWPAIFLDKLLICRSGVEIIASEIINADFANNSTMYWSHMRRNRKTIDLSDGWGHNSQWSTEFRIDLNLNDKYIYNYISRPSRIDLNNFVCDERTRMHGLALNDRINLLRDRCFTGKYTSSDKIEEWNFYPYNDYYEENK